MAVARGGRRAIFDSALALADGDDPRQPALRRALECATDGGQSYVPVEYFGADLTHMAPRDPRFVDARLERVRALCSEAGISPDAAKILTGAPHTVLADLQRRGEADVIVVGALARGRLADLVVGNTAERVLHHGAGDVLVVAPTRGTPSGAVCTAVLS